MAWVLVVFAGLLEVGFALCLKFSDGFTKLWPTVGFCIFGATSFLMLTIALKTLAVGTAYAVWTGIGAAGTVIVGMTFLSEPATAGRIVACVLVVAGIIGLRLYEH